MKEKKVKQLEIVNVEVLTQLHLSKIKGGGSAGDNGGIDDDDDTGGGTLVK